MENINPDDVFNLDLDTVSLITLKNGNILVLDPSVPKNIIQNLIFQRQMWMIKFKLTILKKLR